MNQERLESLDPRVQRAVEELEGTIAKHHPTSTFEVSRGHDEPDNVHLTAIVDVEDTDQVLDLVIDRVVELQVEERIPVHVIPIRTPERVLADMRSRAEGSQRRPGRSEPLVGRAQPAVR